MNHDADEDKCHGGDGPDSVGNQALCHLSDTRARKHKVQDIEVQETEDPEPVTEATMNLDAIDLVERGVDLQLGFRVRLGVFTVTPAHLLTNVFDVLVC